MNNLISNQEIQCACLGVLYLAHQLSQGHVCKVSSKSIDQSGRPSQTHAYHKKKIEEKRVHLQTIFVSAKVTMQHHTKQSLETVLI